MRIKILLIGADPASLVSDAQLLKDRGLLVFTTFNLENIDDMVSEIRPDLVFFDPHQANNAITDAYNQFVNGIQHTNVPVVITLSDDDVYLVTRKRTAAKHKRTAIADNIISAVKLALKTEEGHTIKKLNKLPHQTIPFPQYKPRA